MTLRFESSLYAWLLTCQSFSFLTCIMGNNGENNLSQWDTMPLNKIMHMKHLIVLIIIAIILLIDTIWSVDKFHRLFNMFWSSSFRRSILINLVYSLKHTYCLIAITFKIDVSMYVCMYVWCVCVWVGGWICVGKWILFS